MKTNWIAKKSSQQGAILLEALIAVLIFSMGLLALAGLQAVMAKNTSDSKYRADATFVAQQRLGMLWADPENIGNYVETDTDISTIIPGGKRSTVLPAVGGEVTVTVTWQAPGQDSHQYVTTARVAGG
jgi:type IV pilus assembly protein PilV